MSEQEKPDMPVSAPSEHKIDTSHDAIHAESSVEWLIPAAGEAVEAGLAAKTLGGLGKAAWKITKDWGIDQGIDWMLDKATEVGKKIAETDTSEVTPPSGGADLPDAGAGDVNPPSDMNSPATVPAEPSAMSTSMDGGDHYDANPPMGVPSDNQQSSEANAPDTGLTSEVVQPDGVNQSIAPPEMNQSIAPTASPPAPVDDWSLYRACLADCDAKLKPFMTTVQSSPESDARWREGWKEFEACNAACLEALNECRATGVWPSGASTDTAAAAQTSTPGSSSSSNPPMSMPESP